MARIMKSVSMFGIIKKNEWKAGFLDDGKEIFSSGIRDKLIIISAIDIAFSIFLSLRCWLG